jgi:hypothetical protein
MTIYPYIQQPNVQPNTTGTWMYGVLSTNDLEKIRTIVKEEVHKALHPEESRPSAEVDLVHDGKRYKGTVYQVEEDEDEGV